MPLLTSLAYPNSVHVVMSLLDPLLTGWVRPGVPPGFEPGQKLITVQRVGGGPDDEDITDYPILLVACYGSTFLEASNMQAQCQVKILSASATEVILLDTTPEQRVLIDEADLYIGDQEVPDLYPDERRVTSTYRLGLRRQFRP